MTSKRMVVLTAALFAALAAPVGAQTAPAPDRPSAGAPRTGGQNQGSARSQHGSGRRHGDGMRHRHRMHGGNGMHTGYRWQRGHAMRAGQGMRSWNGHGMRSGMRSQRFSSRRRTYRNGDPRMRYYGRRMPPV